jgi:two-component system sensor histidine kinase RegB
VVEDWRERPCPIIFTDDFGPDVDIVSDPALRQVVGNIVDNAIEVSPQASPSTAQRTRLAGRHHRPRPRLRSPDPRADRQALCLHQGAPGGGLGLFLVVNVARKLGGRLKVDNREEGGARFR